MTSFPIKFTAFKDNTGKCKIVMKSTHLMTFFFIWSSQHQNHISQAVNCLLLIVIKATKARLYLQMWYLQQLGEVFFNHHLPQRGPLPCAPSLLLRLPLLSYRCMGHHALPLSVSYVAQDPGRCPHLPRVAHVLPAS